MQSQLKVMLELQDSMNTHVHAEWRTQNFEWYRAIWVECAELMDHYGWKWWKHQPPDYEQVKLELIDIWHFGLSLLLVKHCPQDLILRELNKSLGASKDGDFREALEQFTANTLSERDFSIPLFSALLDAADMSFTELYSGYIGKNVLNFFRQDNGYKEGTYQKLWDGREDNEHLVELAEQLDASDETFKEKLYDLLDERYKKCLS